MIGVGETVDEVDDNTTALFLGTIHGNINSTLCLSSTLSIRRFSQSGNLNRHMRVHGTNGNGGSSGTGAVTGIPT